MSEQIVLFCLKLVSMEDAPNEVVLAVVSPRRLERLLSNLTILMLIFREVFAILVNLFPLSTRGRHSSRLLPVVQRKGLVLGWLHAWDTQRNVVVGFTFDIFSHS